MSMYGNTTQITGVHNASITSRRYLDKLHFVDTHFPRYRISTASVRR